MEKHIFKITKELIGKRIHVRFIPSTDEVDTEANQQLAKRYCVGRGFANQPLFRYVGHAIVDGEPKVLVYNETVKKEIDEFWFMSDSKMSLNIDVGEEQGYLRVIPHRYESDSNRLDTLSEVKKGYVQAKINKLPSITEAHKYILKSLEGKEVNVLDLDAMAKRDDRERVWKKITIDELNKDSGI